MFRFSNVFIVAAISFGISTAYAQQNNGVKPMGQTRTINQDPIGADHKTVGHGNQNQGLNNQPQQSIPLTDAQRADRAKYLSPEENAFNIRKEIADENVRRAEALKSQTGLKKDQLQNHQLQQPTPLTDAQRADRAKYLSPEENAFNIRKEIADEKVRRAEALRKETGVKKDQLQNNQPQQPTPLTDAQRADRAKYLSPEENAFNIRKELADERFRRNTCYARGGTNC